MLLEIYCIVCDLPVAAIFINKEFYTARSNRISSNVPDFNKIYNIYKDSGLTVLYSDARLDSFRIQKRTGWFNFKK